MLLLLPLLQVRTVGIKGIDCRQDLQELEIPLEILNGPLLKPKALEKLLEEKLPQLKKKIVCIADRTIYRQAPKHVPFLL